MSEDINFYFLNFNYFPNFFGFFTFTNYKKLMTSASAK